MRDKTDLAIVLRCLKYGEADKLVTLFLKGSGKRKGMAKGATVSRRRFAATLEPGAVIQVVFQEGPRSEWLFLKEASLLEHSPKWRRSWKGMVVASFCLELAGRLLPENKEARDKFELLGRLLREVDEANAVQKLLVFESNWIQASGLAPEWRERLKNRPIQTADPASLQKVLDAHWGSLLGKPLLSRKLLDQVFVV
ncbi:MAG: DNA repair protein RecO [Deltaproteobacteria bacterium]|nr:DNA repair protein RecO [Deltaproteobacteria bacterium]